MPTSLPIETGVFYTDSLPNAQPTTDHKGTINFTASPQGTTHTVRLGLNSMDMDHNHNTRIMCDVLTVGRDNAQINLRSWQDTIQYASAAGWLAIPSGDIDCQSDTYLISRDSHDGPLTQWNTRRIQFPRPYSNIPKVAVWLSGIDYSPTQNLRCRIFATDVTTTGFVLHADTWDGTELHMLHVTWLAHSFHRQDISSGSINVWLDSDVLEQWKAYGGRVEFDGPQFAQPPKVFMALNTLDISNQTNQRVKLTANSVTATDMKYRIEGWNDTLLYGAGFTYVAVANSVQS